MFTCIKDIDVDVLTRKYKDINSKKITDIEPILSNTLRRFEIQMRKVFDPEEENEEDYKKTVEFYKKMENITNLNINLLTRVIKLVEENENIDNEDIDNLVNQLIKEEEKNKKEDLSVRIKIKSSVIRYIYLVEKYKNK